MLVLLLLRSTGLAQTLDLVLYDLIISQRAEGSGQNKLRKVLITCRASTGCRNVGKNWGIAMYSTCWDTHPLGQHV